VEFKVRKKRTARSGCPTRACAGLLLGGFDFSRFDFCGGVGVLLGEALDAAGGVNQFLLAGEEGVAARADFNVQLVALDGLTSGEIVAAGALHRYSVIVRVNTGFHEASFCRVRSARPTLYRREELHPERGELQPRR